MGWFSLHGRMRRLLACSVVLLVFAAPAVARADARSSYLVRLLQGSSQFRVRAQAAISLGGGGDEAEVVDALVGALKDKHPAVRAAAATSLGRIGAGRALPALRRLVKDPESPVRSAASGAVARLERSGGSPGPVVTGRGPARFYVAVGTPGTRVDGVDRRVLERAGGFIRSKIAEVDGVEVAPEQEAPARVKGILQARRLKGFFIDSSITGVQKRPGGGLRVVVSVIVATHPGRDMRAILQGAATAIGGGKDAYRQAMEGALAAALRRLPQALER